MQLSSMENKKVENNIASRNLKDFANNIAGGSVKNSFIHQWSKKWKLTSDALLGAAIARDYSEVYTEFNVIHDLMAEFIEFRKITRENSLNDVLKISVQTTNNNGTHSRNEENTESSSDDDAKE